MRSSGDSLLNFIALCFMGEKGSLKLSYFLKRRIIHTYLNFTNNRYFYLKTPEEQAEKKKHNTSGTTFFNDSSKIYVTFAKIHCTSQVHAVF